MEGYYRSKAVIEMTGVKNVTLNRWSQLLRDTYMVKKEGKYLYFHPHFIRFIKSRLNSQGPSGLPPESRIADLYRLWYLEKKNIEEIATELGENQVVIFAQLQEVGIE